MSKKPINSPPIMKKQSAMIFAAITFAAGFLAGVVFTVFKTNSDSAMSISTRTNLQRPSNLKAH